jgi:phenylalanyl-tRNA synthetase beta chain
MGVGSSVTDDTQDIFLESAFLVLVVRVVSACILTHHVMKRGVDFELPMIDAPCTEPFKAFAGGEFGQLQVCKAS